MFTLLRLRRAGWLFIALFMASCHDKPTQFSKISASKSGISFVNKLPEKGLFNILYYLYFYNGGGVATGDINKDGLPDIYFTANSRGHNKLYINKGDFKFEDVTATAGVAGTSDWCAGAVMADVNGDGWLDIYVSSISKQFGLKGHNELFINKGDGTFREESAKYGLNFSGLSGQSAFFDYDHDGDLDCYLLNQSSAPHSNVVDTSFRQGHDSLAGDVLYRNDIVTTGKFTNVTVEAGIYNSKLGYGLGLAVADINQDGWDDIYVGNDFHENDYYYINQGNGKFKESGGDHFRHYSRFSMGNDVNDYNNDGQPDVVTVDMLPPDEATVKTYGSDENQDIYNLKLISNGYQHQVSRNCLQRNNGLGGSFSDVALMAGVYATDWSWAPLFADFDNDGKKDLFISSGIVKRPVDLDYIRFVSDLNINKGLDYTDKYDKQAIDAMPDGSSHPYFFRNNSDYSFSDVSKEWGTGSMKGYFNGSSYADLDNDGDLDMIINAINDEAVLLRNNSKGTHSITFSFEGKAPNSFGFGTKVYLFQGKGLQYQQLSPSRGFQSSVEPCLHFGLGVATTIDSVVIVWPDQHYQTIKNVPADKPILVKQFEAAGHFDQSVWLPDVKLPYEKTELSTWKHRENEFVDNNTQYLIPHFQSTRGPKVAVGDVNGDGLDDLYACGAKDQPGALLIQQRDGHFVTADTAVFGKDDAPEDVDAVFFDADGDRDQDLLVITGGNQVLKKGREGEDRIYINDGKGHFTKKELAFPIEYESKSCVAVADVDKDGDIDFFIGNLSNPTAYGQPVHSFLYLNRGDAQFDVATAKTIFLQSQGMVTDADFADLNADGWPDLILTGEWMPVRIFYNEKGHFGKPVDLPASTGLWQSLYPADVNGDGKIDLLAGNWGHNSKLFAGKNGPLKLYVKDFDNNGSVEQVMCYTINGKEYTFLAKDELERPLPVLKKGYLKYGEVAGKTVQYIFDDLFKDYQELKAEILSSSVFINNGQGSFMRQDLPDPLQISPVMAFTSNDHSFIGAGNFYGVIPYEGRYDAQVPVSFVYRSGAPALQHLFNNITTEVRDLKWIRTISDKKILVVASNNGPLQFLRFN